FFTWLAIWSLSEYSSSRLEKLCQSRQRPELAEQIFEHDDDTLLALRAWMWLSLVSGAVLPGASEFLETFTPDEQPRRLSVWWWSSRLVIGSLGCIVLDLWVARPLAAHVAERFLVKFWTVLNLMRLAMTPILWVIGRVDGMLERLQGRRNDGGP